MQLTIQDDILLIIHHRKIIYAEMIRYDVISGYLIACGYRPQAAQAIAYGALHHRATTIILAETLKLLCKS